MEEIGGASLERYRPRPRDPSGQFRLRLIAARPLRLIAATGIGAIQSPFQASVITGPRRLIYRPATAALLLFPLSSSTAATTAPRHTIVLHITEQKNPIPGRCLLPENNLFRETSRSIFERVRGVRACVRARADIVIYDREFLQRSTTQNQYPFFSIDESLSFLFFSFWIERGAWAFRIYRFFLLSSSFFSFLRFDRTFASLKKEKKVEILNFHGWKGR